MSGCGTDADALASVAEELGSGHLMWPSDVAQSAQVDEFAARVLQTSGAPDLLLNNAGLINRNAPLWEVSAAEFSRVIDVNLKGVQSMIRAFVPAMIRRGSGVVVNFSSGWGRSTSAEVAPYCASKWGVEGLTASLAQELPSGLAAVALNPGIIDTRMLRSCFGDAASAYPGAARWAAIAVPYLASIGPRHNGQPLTVPDA